MATLSIVTVGIAETLWLIAMKRSLRWRAALVDAGSAGVLGFGGLLVGGVLAGLFAAAFAIVGDWAPNGAVRLWSDHPVLGFAVAFVAWDLLGHVYHRIGHGTAIGWAAHRPHHTGEVFSLTLAWRQSWLPVHSVVLPIVALGGWSLRTILACAAISNVIQALQHSATMHPLPAWFRAAIMTPTHHRHHHGAGQELAQGGKAVEHTVNLGPVFTIWDRLGGTYVGSMPSQELRYGTTTPGIKPLRSQFDGWVELVARRRWLQPRNSGWQVGEQR